MGPSRIERYVLGRNLWAVGATLAIVAWVVVLLEFVEVSRPGSDAGGSFAAGMTLALFKSPTTILTLLPFCFLFGAVAAFVGLNRSSELVAMRAAGVSAWRFIFPTAIAAFLVGLWSVTVAGPMASSLNARYQTSSALLAGGQAAAPKETWLRQEDGRNVIYIEAVSCTASADAVSLGSVTMLLYAKQQGEGLTFSRQITASQAQLSAGAWRLTDATESLPGAGAMHSDNLSIPSDLDASAACERFATPDAVSFWRLPDLIAQTEKVGLSATAYRLRLQQLLATPLLFSAMTVLAAAFSLRLVRLGNLGLMAASGVGIGFAVFFLAQLCGALGKAEALSPALAAWAPPLAALLVGFTMLCYTEDG
ncbi:MAG: lptG [Caulobacteraceae bacterium]|nr:lptG [Caulobacteraceae bacterium]